MIATIPDLLRLLALPAFGWAAYRDVETRRVPNRTWYPLAALAAVLLVWELAPAIAGGIGPADRLGLVRTAVSIGFVLPLAYGFWLIGGFGGADAKAFFVVALLFPTYPAYDLAGIGLGQVPAVRTAVGVFSLTVLSNTVLMGAAYPLVLAARNAAAGYVSPGMFVAKPIPAAEATAEYGTILEFSDRSLTDDLSPSGLREFFSYRGLDLDALRMYLQWRDLSLASLRADPERYRDPDSLPDEPGDPGDGSITVTGDGGGAGTDRAGGGPTSDWDGPGTTDPGTDDPWGADAFLSDIEGSAYGTTPERLRTGLDLLAGAETVWVSPGIPFLVPLFVGLLVSLTVGDLLFVGMDAAGLL
ncbi:MAG: prepilin peptidase [Salinirussus sp.]